MTIKKGHNFTKGDNPDLKKYVSIFLRRNPYMKFQNCILISFELTHGRTEGQTDARTRRKQYAPSTLSKLVA